MFDYNDEIPDIQIPGVDADAALELYDDDMDIYLPILRSFCPNASAVIEKMRTVSSEAALSPETLADYAIAAHGLKGICANIGAKKASNAALDLEMKAKAGDIAGVLAGNEALLNEAQTVVTGVQVWLEKHDNQNPKPRLASPDRTLLARLYQCCKTYDMQGIDEIMEQLESAEYDADGSLIPWLREKINASDFSSVAERLAEYGA